MPSLLDAAGRRRSPATLPGYHSGRPPRNKGLRYLADPPTVEEIVAVMRQAGGGVHGVRLRALMLLWRAGLRSHEALTVTEHDLDARRGSVLVRNGKGGRRREVGMHPWGWEQLRPWLELRPGMPVGPLLSVTPGPRVGGPGRAAPAAVRPAPATPRPRRRARTRRRAAQRHPTPARPHQPRRHLDLPARHDNAEIIATVHARLSPMIQRAPDLDYSADFLVVADPRSSSPRAATARGDAQTTMTPRPPARCPRIRSDPASASTLRLRATR